MGVELAALGGEELDRKLPCLGIRISKDKLELSTGELPCAEELQPFQHQVRSNSQVRRLIRLGSSWILCCRLIH